MSKIATSIGNSAAASSPAGTRPAYTQKELYGWLAAVFGTAWFAFFLYTSKELWLLMFVVLSGRDLASSEPVALSLNYVLAMLFTAVWILVPSMAFAAMTLVAWGMSFVPPSLRTTPKRQ